MVERDDDGYPRAAGEVREMARDLERVNELGQRFASTMGRAFRDIALRGKSFGDVLRNLAQQMANLALQAAFKPLQNALGSAFAGLFATRTPGAVVPFAQGGVVAAPSYFPLSGGRVGLMGERGAEAIMPLARGPDGRLGVRAQAGGGQSQNITINIATPDVDGFRRSQSQIAAMLSRTVAQGQRNL